MTPDENSLTRFERYHGLTGTPKILTPHLIDNWQNIVSAAFDANFIRDNDGEFGIPDYLSTMETLPEVTSHVLRQPDLLLWRRAERILEQLGFTSDCFEYYKSGGEALIFTIKGVPDLLLKIAKQNPQFQSTNFVMHPVGRFVVQPGNGGSNESSASADVTPISIAFVPLAAGTYSDKMNIGKKCNSPIGIINMHPHLQQTVLNDVKLNDMPLPFRVSLDKLDGLLAHEDLSFFDMKTPNVICLPNHPELPLICDPRAIKRGSLTDVKGSPAHVPENDYAIINKRYADLQRAITGNIARSINDKYEKAFGMAPCDAVPVIVGLEPLTEEMPDKDVLELIIKTAKLSKKSLNISSPAAATPPLPPLKK